MSNFMFRGKTEASSADPDSSLTGGDIS